MSQFKHSIMYKILFWYIILNAFFFLLFGIMLVTYSARTLEKEVSNYMEIILGQAVNSYNTRVSNIRSSIASLASDTDIAAKLSSDKMSTQEQLNLDRYLSNILNNSRFSDSIISDIFICGNNGYVYNSTSRSGLSVDYSFINQDWYKEAIDVTNNVFIHFLDLHPQDFYSNISLPHTSSSYTFSISCAIVNSDYEAVGAVICNFDLAELANAFMSSNCEKDSQIALIDDSGIILAKSDNADIGACMPLSEETLLLISSKNAGKIKVKIDNHSYLLCYKATNTEYSLISFVPAASIALHIQPIYLFMLLALLVCLVINILISWFIYQSIRKPIHKLIYNISTVDFDQLSLQDSGYTYTELEQIASRFNILLKNLDDMIKKDYKSQILLNKTQLYALQTQINPHYLMNSLQLLQTEITCGDIKTANTIIVSISRLLNYALYNYNKEVKIADELGYIQTYLSLFAKKSFSRLTVDYQVDESIQEQYMPKMLLQPIIENCLAHAFPNEGNDDWHIVIRATSDDNTVIISIIDNGIGIDPLTLKELRQSLSQVNIDDPNIGLRNVHQRIKMLYGQEYGLHICNNDHNGTCISIHLPLI